MLSDRDKEEMLADARSDTRRESFRKVRALQASRSPSFKEYCAFCESVASLFPRKPPVRPLVGPGGFRL